VISLPMGPALTRMEREAVIAAVNAWQE